MSRMKQAAEAAQSRAKQHTSSAVRITMLGVSLLLQIALLAGVFVLFRKQFNFFYGACEILSLFVVLYIIREDSNPTYKLPWIILNLTLPILGGLTYLMFGRVRFSRGERRRGVEIAQCYLDAARIRPGVTERVPPEYRTECCYLRNRAAAPAYDHTDVTFYSEGETFWRAMLEELKKAERFIFLEYFIIAPGAMWDSILDILKEKVRAGVDVRVIYDDIGCIGRLPSDYAAQLERAGIRCLTFNRFTNIFSSRFNNRDHRKICVVDGNVGFTGGVNLADEYINAVERFGYWKDTAVRLRGDAVWSLTAMFLALWDFERRQREDPAQFAPTVRSNSGGFVQPYNDIPLDREYVGETVYRNILNHARDYVYITTPYLIIDNVMITALTTAAKSGVDVRIIMPGIPDKKLVYTLSRSYYGVLMAAGVKIYEYTPGFIHAKEFVADDRCAVVGSINLDYRSLCHHFECAAWMCDVPAVMDVKKDFLETLEKCREITPEIYRRECNRHPLLLAVLRIFAPLM